MAFISSQSRVLPKQENGDSRRKIGMWIKEVDDVLEGIRAVISIDEMREYKDSRGLSIQSS